MATLTVFELIYNTMLPSSKKKNVGHELGMAPKETYHSIWNIANTRHDMAYTKTFTLSTIPQQQVS